MYVLLFIVLANYMEKHGNIITNDEQKIGTHLLLKNGIVIHCSQMLCLEIRVDSLRRR